MLGPDPIYFVTKTAKARASLPCEVLPFEYYCHSVTELLFGEVGSTVFPMEAALLGFKEEADVEDDTTSSSSSRRLVPWLNWDEWLFVKDSLFSDSPHSVSSALKRVSFSFSLSSSIFSPHVCNCKSVT